MYHKRPWAEENSLLSLYFDDNDCAADAQTAKNSVNKVNQ